MLLQLVVYNKKNIIYSLKHVNVDCACFTLQFTKKEAQRTEQSENNFEASMHRALESLT